MTRDEIIEMARELQLEVDEGENVCIGGEPCTTILKLLVNRAVAKEREAMKPAIIEALKAETREMENYSYFGSNKGVSVDDYEDVADAAIAIRARSQ